MRITLNEFIKKEGLNSKETITFVKNAMNNNLKGHVFNHNNSVIEIDQYAVDFIKEYFSIKKEDIISVGEINLTTNENVSNVITKEIDDMEDLILSKTNEIVNFNNDESEIDVDMDYDMQKIYEMRLKEADTTIQKLKKKIADQNKTITSMNKALETDALIILKLKQDLTAREIEISQYEESLIENLKMKIKGKKKNDKKNKKNH